MLCFWSPKGGSGTSVVTAVAGLVLARSAPARVVDLTGDLPAVLGLADDPAPGLHDWLRAGAQAPTEALDRLAVDIASRLSLLPAGEIDHQVAVAPEAGAALAVALDSERTPTVCDAGRLDTPALRAFAEVAGPNLIVVRGCYLALRRAVHHPAMRETVGAVHIDEHGRSLNARDVEDVLGVPVVASIVARTSTARAVDAGVLLSRVPESVSRPLKHALVTADWFGGDGEQAA